MNTTPRVVMALLVAVAMAISGCAAPPPAQKPVRRQVDSQAELRKNIACTDHANIVGSPGSGPYFWRFVFRLFPYLEGNAFDKPYGCVTVQRNGDREIRYQDTVPCSYKPKQGAPSELDYKQVQIDPISFASPDFLPAEIELSYAEFTGQGYFECDLDLKQYLVNARAQDSRLGITSTLPLTETYAYFSLSAFMLPLSNTSAVSGTVFAIEPQCDSTVEIACKPSFWIIEAADGGVRFKTSFNGREIITTPKPFEIGERPQAWWVGLSEQYDQLIMTDTLRIDHYQDVAIKVGQSDEHVTTRFTNRYPLFKDDVRVQFPLSPVKIYIGGGPSAEYSPLTGAFFQLSIDPTGGSKPDGAM